MTNEKNSLVSRVKGALDGGVAITTGIGSLGGLPVAGLLYQNPGQEELIYCTIGSALVGGAYGLLSNMYRNSKKRDD